MIVKTLTAIFIALLLTSCSTSETDDVNKSVEKKQTVAVEKKEPIVQEKSQKETINKTKLKKSILTIQTLDGKKIHVDEALSGLTFQEYKNKTVFVIFFGYRCPPCIQEMPHLIELMNKNHPDLEIIALEVQGLNKEKLTDYQKRRGLNYTLAVGKENNQFINYIASRAQWQGSIPFFIAFDKKGKVKVVQVGSLSGQQLNGIYQELK